MVGWNLLVLWLLWGGSASAETNATTPASVATSKQNTSEPVVLSPAKLLYFVPGASYKHPEYWVILASNLRIVHNSTQWQVECIIYIYDDTPPIENSTDIDYILRICSTHVYYHGNYGDHIKAMPPSPLRMGGFTHVLLCLDDVALMTDYHVDDQLMLMQRNDLQMLSPLVKYASIGKTKAQQYEGLGIIVDAIEVHVILFTMDAWECFHDLINPKWNNQGRGYERYLCHACQQYWAKKHHVPVWDVHILMGIVYTNHALHVGATKAVRRKGVHDQLIKELFISQRNSPPSALIPSDSVFGSDLLLNEMFRALRSPPCVHPVGFTPPATSHIANPDNAMHNITLHCQVHVLNRFKAFESIDWRMWIQFEGMYRKRVFFSKKYDIIGYLV